MKLKNILIIIIVIILLLTDVETRRARTRMAGRGRFSGLSAIGNNIGKAIQSIISD